MSDTPRTDAHNWHDGDYDDPLQAFADFAKQLERELNAANQRIKRLEEAGDAALNYSIGLDLQKENDALKQRIKRLEELGHKLRECASQIGWTSSEDPRWLKRAEAAVEAWDKEAKP